MHETGYACENWKYRLDQEMVKQEKVIHVREESADCGLENVKAEFIEVTWKCHESTEGGFYEGLLSLR